MYRKYAHMVFPIASGVLLACCFPTFHWYPLAWAALIPLFLVGTTASPADGAARFFLAGWAFHSFLLQWLITNIFWAGGWAIIGQQLLCIALALFWAVLGGIWAWARGRAPQWAGALLLALLWAVMEWGQATLFTGFGWSALGYSQGPDLPLLQWAAVGGVSLISFVLVLVNGNIALALAERQHRVARLATSALVVIAAHAGGWLLLDTPDYASRPFTAGVLQPNFPQEMKWDWEYSGEMVRKTARMSAILAKHESVDAFFWPEALLMRHFEAPEMMEPVVALATETGAAVFTGAVRDDAPAGKSYNSSVLVRPDGSLAGHYDKVRLAPFGEYMPFTSIFPFLRQIVPMDVDAGGEHRVFNLDDRRLGPMICFEVLFRPVSETLRRLGADMLAVVTNLAWFGASNAIPQELEIARLRAVEMRLPLVHSANTGISGVFDPWGRFTPVNAFIGPQEQYYKAPPGHVQPPMLHMRRCLGALPVAAPGARPVPGGPTVFPWIATAVAGLWLVLVWRRRAASRGEPRGSSQR